MRVMLIVAILVSVGCESEDRPPSPPPDDGAVADGGPDTGTPDTGTPDTGTPDTGTPDASLPCDPAGACCNASDLAAIMALYGAGMDVDYGDVASGCGQGCALDADPATCTAACLGMQTMDAASDGCEACYVTSVLCAISNCVGQCIADPGSDACVACICGDNAEMEDCMGDFTVCSGVPVDTCE